MRQIAIFIPSFRGGGAERCAIVMANRLVERGYQVDMVVVSGQGPLKKMIHDDVRIVDFKKGRTWSTFFSLARYLRRKRPAVLFSHIDHVNVVAILASRLSMAGTKIVVTVHDTLSRAARESMDVRDKLIPFLVRCLYPLAARVVAVSRGTADDLVNCLNLDPRLVQVIHNPVVTPELMSRAKEDHPWFSNNERQVPVILGVGRLTALKDFMTLIRAFDIVLQKRKTARLVILGEGGERSKLETVIRRLELEDRVCLPGFFDNPYAVMAKASVFVLSSRWEALPTVLIEAMALGIPVVSTDCPSGPNEILVHGEFGPLIEVGDHRSMAQAILDTLDHPILPHRLQIRAKDFSDANSLAEYEKLITTLSKTIQNPN